jgi:hypothetical protein
MNESDKMIRAMKDREAVRLLFAGKNEPSLSDAISAAWASWEFYQYHLKQQRYMDRHVMLPESM